MLVFAKQPISYFLRMDRVWASYYPFFKAIAMSIYANSKHWTGFPSRMLIVNIFLGLFSEVSIVNHSLNDIGFFIMAGLLAGVDQRTQLVGHNRLELLLFRLNGKQRYGINVFKVREVLRCPALNKVPNAHPAVCGVATLRGKTITVIDLQMAVGIGSVDDPSNCSVIVTEYNRSIQGFLVPHIEHIINKHWEEVLVPPKIIGANHYVTSVTQLNEEIIEILDVEKVLYGVTGFAKIKSSLDHVDTDTVTLASRCQVLVADDSAVARNQIKRTLEPIGVNLTICGDGNQALKTLQQWKDDEPEKLANLILVISDVEMPEMDGYTLTNEIRDDPQLSHLHILLHTSLSGVFDSSLLENVKANGFLSKFDSNELSSMVLERLREFFK